MADVAGRVLVDHALEAAKNAHAPYSRFAVGAALLLTDGTIVPGTNFENASYGLSLCAETVALAAANVAGRLRDVVAIGIVGGAMAPGGGIDGDGAIYPCGRCRQVLNEAADLGGRDIIVYCGSADGSILRRHLLSELLPHAFGPADLGIG
ncbi:cytidine deaminase [Sphingomonas nostoxanthinifaciens]|uniref:cytidine deaminase n=1 Tax=Sphingomonas nostoxanthinifaciens TaxID=2872652 RepID=UPI001CC2170B|nr:cytidine deaminase [Sphingomonas nostoxanthinifaciens]UAK23897.1 cytidine deaminase [Sphingomonas nostoxanthinifaciens]